jgi:hypothetical protein
MTLFCVPDWGVKISVDPRSATSRTYQNEQKEN